MVFCVRQPGKEVPLSLSEKFYETYLPIVAGGDAVSDLPTGRRNYVWECVAAGGKRISDSENGIE